MPSARFIRPSSQPGQRSLKAERICFGYAKRFRWLKLNCKRSMMELHERLVEKLADVPTPAGPTPRTLAAQLQSPAVTEAQTPMTPGDQRSETLVASLTATREATRCRVKG